MQFRKFYRIIRSRNPYRIRSRYEAVDYVAVPLLAALILLMFDIVYLVSHSKGIAVFFF